MMTSVGEFVCEKGQKDALTTEGRDSRECGVVVHLTADKGAEPVPSMRSNRPPSFGAKNAVMNTLPLFICLYCGIMGIENTPGQ
jgi:hypothetical protein